MAHTDITFRCKSRAEAIRRIVSDLGWDVDDYLLSSVVKREIILQESRLATDVSGISWNCDIYIHANLPDSEYIVFPHWANL